MTDDKLIFPTSCFHKADVLQQINSNFASWMFRSLFWNRYNCDDIHAFFVSFTMLNTFICGFFLAPQYCYIGEMSGTVLRVALSVLHWANDWKHAESCYCLLISLQTPCSRCWKTLQFYVYVLTMYTTFVKFARHVTRVYRLVYLYHTCTRVPFSVWTTHSIYLLIFICFQNYPYFMIRS